MNSVGESVVKNQKKTVDGFTSKRIPFGTFFADSRRESESGRCVKRSLCFTVLLICDFFFMTETGG